MTGVVITTDIVALSTIRLALYADGWTNYYGSTLLELENLGKMLGHVDVLFISMAVRASEMKKGRKSYSFSIGHMVSLRSVYMPVSTDGDYSAHLITPVCTADVARILNAVRTLSGEE